LVSNRIDTLSLELLASRICHDLVSPVGAIHNGVEFLQEMGADAGDEATELISMSANQAAARLQVFRIVYGSGGKDQSIKPSDIHEVFGDYISASSKLSQEWSPDGDLGFEEYPVAYSKMLMGLLMLAEEALPKGGVIGVRAGKSPNSTEVTAEGENCGLSNLAIDAMNAKISPEVMDPRLIHPFVLAVLADNYSFEISFSKEEDNKAVFVLGKS
jgi:histidine phosphotransferase ChpT